jgi:hypothetical protein
MIAEEIGEYGGIISPVSVPSDISMHVTYEASGVKTGTRMHIYKLDRVYSVESKLYVAHPQNSTNSHNLSIGMSQEDFTLCTSGILLLCMGI